MKLKLHKRVLAVVLSLMLAFALLPATVLAAEPAPEGIWTDYAATGFAGGSGTEDDPYQIATAEQLAYLAVKANEGTLHNLGKYFTLTDNINFSGHQWIPIGRSFSNQSQYFDGYFDGNRKIITGLYVDESADGYVAGLFGTLLGQVHDLTIEDAYVKTSGSNSSAGILAGKVSNPGTKITNCHVSGTVESDSVAGGLVGYSSYTEFEDCSAKAEVSATGNNIGGFIGEGFAASFADCTAEGSVTGSWCCGGFAGIIWSNAQAERCLADVDVTATDWNTGGFVEYIEENTTISNCAALGDVSNPVTNNFTKLGGFVGSLDNTYGDNTIQNCYAAGTVIGGNDTHPAGGFVGYTIGGRITGCVFNVENNPALKSVGEPASTGFDIDAAKTNEVMTDICGSFGHQAGQPQHMEPTCTQPGADGVILCQRCGTVLDEGTAIPATGHTWGNPEWNWSEDGKTCKATFTCLKDNSHKEALVATVTPTVKTPATCTAMGVTTYTAEVTFNGQTYNSTKTIEDIMAAGHNYKDGKCTVCGAADPSYNPVHPTDPDSGDTNAPQTGDHSNMILLIALLCASGIGIITAIVYSMKKRKAK